MKVNFLPEGGFEYLGVVIEYEGDAPTGDEPEYERRAFLTVDFTCAAILTDAIFLGCPQTVLVAYAGFLAIPSTLVAFSF